LVLAARRFPRQALHAEAIEFEHPVRGVSVAISAPYPEDLVELLKALVFPLSSVGTTVCSPL
jgi:23S rRNA pseudouridine1911/1915/1917 synthase